MCKTKRKTDATNPPSSVSHRRPPLSTAPSSSTSYSSSSAAATSSLSSTSKTTASASSSTSLSSLRSSLPENPHIYSFPEISSATNNFLCKPITSSSSAWRCSLRGKDVVIVHRKLHRQLDLPHLRPLLSSICKNHHSSIIKLLGASLSGDHIYLVYNYIPGATLSDCLRNPKNRNFTILNNWLSRMQIATDLAEALQYIHHFSGITDLRLIHNHIKTSTIIVTDPNLNAMICHFGLAQLTGELEISSGNRIEATVGYMAPELSTAGIVSQKSDVFAFGVVMLEILCGEESLKYRYDKTSKDYEMVSVVERARDVIASDDKGRLRQWIDRRLRDSYPVDVADKVTRLALDCVHVEPDKRPDMKRVAGKISKMYLESKGWSEMMRLPTDFTVSIAPR